MKTLPFFQAFAITAVAVSFVAETSLAQNRVGGPVARKLQSLQADEIGVPRKRPDAEPSIKKRPERPVSITPMQDSEAKAVEKMERAESASACLAQLQIIAEANRAASPPSTDKQCTINDPVELVATKGPYPVVFASGLILDCKFAAALAEFTTNTLQPLARHHLETTVTKLRSGQGFVCRRRNNAQTGKLSEHAFGNAFDLTAYVLEGKPALSVQAEKQMKPAEAIFQRALRKAACGTFTTVLGPGSNEAHASHLHFDLGRSGKKNPYRICE